MTADSYRVSQVTEVQLFFFFSILTKPELYHLKKRMLRIISSIKRLYHKCLFDEKDKLRHKKWYQTYSF